MSTVRRLILAFDFGLKRIGVATGNLFTGTASPLTTLTVRRDTPWDEIDTLIKDWHPDLIVVGQPGPDAAANLLTALERFIDELTKRQNCPIAQVDERFTSTAAAAELRNDRRKGHYNRRLRKEQIDSRAACLIAEQWINETIDRD